MLISLHLIFHCLLAVMNYNICPLNCIVSIVLQLKIKYKIQSDPLNLAFGQFIELTLPDQSERIYECIIVADNLLLDSSGIDN